MITAFFFCFKDQSELGEEVMQALDFKVSIS